MNTPVHIPVLLRESVEALAVHPGGRYVDCTLGGGGHAVAILERCMPGGHLLGIDADPAAIEAASASLVAYRDSFRLVNENFARVGDICRRHNFVPVDGILFDLGLSSMQLEAANRGFSFQTDAPLDMRFGPGQKLTAADIVNTYPEDQLAGIIWTFGEERRSRRIALQIVRSRPLRTTFDLVSVIERAVGQRHDRIHLATRTFQALRIAVNEEMTNLEKALAQAVELLSPGGRLVVISYHSLEDRIVKQFMRRESTDCVCPPGTPMCVCEHKASLALVNRKIMTPSPTEIEANPRSRSARLRAAERLPLGGGQSRVVTRLASTIVTGSQWIAFRSSRLLSGAQDYDRVQLPYLAGANN
ncbi:MAG: 16S rRNA (cytosine(1402)-N(4))-methyltransferase RsmH [Chloroflexi bacterium]|nr:16S rRNA (cytosine(1402)-N(4))-methyltransferase RsmH [Chloroflexota bacterium]